MTRIDGLEVRRTPFIRGDEALGMRAYVFHGLFQSESLSPWVGGVFI